MEYPISSPASDAVFFTHRRGPRPHACYPDDINSTVNSGNSLNKECQRGQYGPSEKAPLYNTACSKNGLGADQLDRPIKPTGVMDYT